MGKKRKTFYFDKTVEVEIDVEDLEEAGYHHEDDCPARQQSAQNPALAEALASLHRQAHPDGPLQIFLCREEPCRSLDTDVIGYRAAVPAVAA